MNTPPTLRCPKCHQALEMDQREGTAVGVCRRCKGIWLAKAGLEAILEGKGATDAAGRAYQLDQVFHEPSQWACPACQRALMTTWLAEVEIDYCPACKGIFLDAGELNDVALRDYNLQEFGRTESKKGDALRLDAMDAVTSLSADPALERIVDWGLRRLGIRGLG
ncbi:MAG: zf-TFIIB domain-containing protein [Deltaproteobacteria bacterium]|nr:zf-TFIIB domain-containing protein [Deltaproteobacteria bacterium]